MQRPNTGQWSNCSGFSGPDVLFLLPVPANRSFSYTISTIGSNYDTTLGLATGCSSDSVVFGCNDDGAGSQSIITGTVAAAASDRILFIIVASLPRPALWRLRSAERARLMHHLVLSLQPDGYGSGSTGNLTVCVGWEFPLCRKWP